MVGGIAGHGVHTHQLQQALGIHGGFQCFTHNAGGVIEAEESITQAVLRAAKVLADAGGGKAVADFFHQISFTGNIAASGGNAAAGVLDKAARDNVRAGGDDLLN